MYKTAEQSKNDAIDYLVNNNPVVIRFFDEVKDATNKGYCEMRFRVGENLEDDLPIVILTYLREKLKYEVSWEEYCDYYSVSWY